MRILITLATAVLSAAAATAASSSGIGGGAVTAAAAGAPCHPSAGDTVWAWPLAGSSTAPAPVLAPAPVPAPAPAYLPTSASASTYTSTSAFPSVFLPLRAPEPVSAPPVLRGFEPPARRWDAGHRGVDLGGAAGAAVLAAGPGRVLFAGRVVDQGVVVIGHGVLRTSYEPVDASVVVGDRVTAGQRIGTLDAGHCAATACLHWGLLSGHAHATVYYDPLLLLGCGGVRLEPTDGYRPTDG